MSVGREMPRYSSHKIVWALKIKSVEPCKEKVKLTFHDEGYAGIEVDYAVISRYTPVDGDYYVVYSDGYKSISPAKAFEEGYTKL